MSSVEFEVREHVGWVTLNRPEVVNALNREMNERLETVWRDIDRDDAIRVVVLTATGTRGFCAGADLRSEEDDAGRRVAHGGGLTGVGGPLATLRKPLVIGVHGHVLGVGFELALCADIIVAGPNTKFGLPEAQIGVISGSGVVHRAIRQLPRRVAMAMILAGERLEAQDALRYGLINEISAEHGLNESAGRWAAKIASASPLAAQAAKHAALSRMESPLEVALTAKFELIEAYSASRDNQEARTAFLERRRPIWLGC